MPGLKHRFFFVKSYWKNEDISDYGIGVRVEQGRKGKQFDVSVPKELLANLIWFSEIKSFDELLHLIEVD